MDPNALMYPQFYDMTRRFFPQFLSILPPTPPQTAVRPPQSAAPSPPDSAIIFVQGDAGAASYHVPAGGNAVLFDSESDRVYIKSVDADGRPHTRFSPLAWEDFRAPDDPANRFVSIDDFNKFKDELMAAIQQIPVQKEANNG